VLLRLPSLQLPPPRPTLHHQHISISRSPTDRRPTSNIDTLEHIYPPPTANHCRCASPHYCGFGRQSLTIELTNLDYPFGFPLASPRSNAVNHAFHASGQSGRERPGTRLVWASTLKRHTCNTPLVCPSACPCHALNRRFWVSAHTGRGTLPT
jgi:hypothetical protein